MERREKGQLSSTRRALPNPTQKTTHIPPDKFKYLWDLFNIADDDGSGAVRLIAGFSFLFGFAFSFIFFLSWFIFSFLFFLSSRAFLFLGFRLHSL